MQHQISFPRLALLNMHIAGFDLRLEHLIVDVQLIRFAETAQADALDEQAAECIRLFDNCDATLIELECTRVVEAPAVTHLFSVVK